MIGDPGTALLIFGVSAAAGLLGSILGLGGGIIIIPALTLLFKVDIRHAIGASAVSVIATSCGAAASYLRDRITNIRIGMFLEVATTTGALTGAYLGGLVSPRFLYIVFALMMGYSALAMFKRRNVEVPQGVPPHPLARRLRLEGSYYDQALGKEVEYEASGVLGGFGIMYLAGVVSGLLGLGSGVLKVAAMDIVMKLPMK
ncbi:MAG: sulfite exporter TauE/SafE family protein, partial [Thermacetogeniaceae bacterium]